MDTTPTDFKNGDWTDYIEGIIISLMFIVPIAVCLLV